MATSATGRVTDLHARRARPPGFTLVEVLVVLVLISIIISFAVLSVDTGPEELRREGDRLASLLQLAAEDAVMNGREYRLLPNRRGYTFEQLIDGKWRPGADELLRDRELPAGTILGLELEGEPVSLPWPGSQSDEDPPALLLLSSGEITPFTITIRDEANREYLVASRDDSIEANPAR